MKKLLAIFFLILCHSYGSYDVSDVSADELKPVPWENLAKHIEGMTLSAPDNLVSCPADLDMTSPYTTVLQWIENTCYRWREYETGGRICVFMEVPEYGPLSAEQANVLLRASSLWMQAARIQPEARVSDFSQVELKTVAPPSNRDIAIFNTLPEFGSIHSPVMEKAPVPWKSIPLAETAAFQAIIGTDDRVPVGDTTLFPFNAIAFLLMTRQGGYYSGTAFLVSPYTALTNGHLVFDHETRTWSDSAIIYPGQYETGFGQAVQPYGGTDAVLFQTNTVYEQYGSVGYDFASVHFDSPVSGISTFMPLQFGYDMDNNDTILNSAGYPAVVHGSDTLNQWYDYAFSSYHTTDTVARYYIDVTEGSSGSPVWLFQENSRYVVAINAAGWPNGLPNGGPRLTAANRNLIESWVAWTPPDSESPAPDETPVPEISSIHFDPSFYLNKYLDLVTAGYTLSNAEHHWDNMGIHEGRQGCEVFDVRFYLWKYPDLQIAYGTNYYAAHTHWQYNGIHEGRQGSASFDAKTYLQRYPDLLHAFGNDYHAAALHYMNKGKQEGRNGRP